MRVSDGEARPRVRISDGEARPQMRASDGEARPQMRASDAKARRCHCGSDGEARPRVGVSVRDTGPVSSDIRRPRRRDSDRTRASDEDGPR